MAALIIPHTIWQAYPSRNDFLATLSARTYHSADMAQDDSKAFLWAAVQALMNKHFGDENLNRLARVAKFGPGTASRLKAQATSVGLDTLDKLAQAFSVEPWQLLVPGFDPDAPPGGAQPSPMARDIAQMLDAIEDDGRRQRAYALVVQVLQFGGADGESETAPTPAPAPTAAQSAGM